MGKKVRVIELIELYQEEKDGKLKGIIYNKIYQKFEKFISTTVNNYCNYYGMDREELMQEASITLLVCLKNYSFSRKSFLAYFTCSLKNNFADMLKAHIKYTSAVVLIDNEDQIETIEAENRCWEDLRKEESLIEGKMMAKDIMDSITKKPHKDLLNLRFWEGMSFEEIGEVTGGSRQSTSQLYNRVIDKIRGEFRN